MKIPQLKNKKRTFKERPRFNPHTYWMWLLCLTVLLIAGELLYFSFYFLNTTKVLDEPALPTLETNSAQIARMKKKLETVEEAVKNRTGQPAIKEEVQ